MKKSAIKNFYDDVSGFVVGLVTEGQLEFFNAPGNGLTKNPLKAYTFVTAPDLARLIGYDEMGVVLSKSFLLKCLTKVGLGYEDIIRVLETEPANYETYKLQKEIKYGTFNSTREQILHLVNKQLAELTTYHPL